MYILHNLKMFKNYVTSRARGAESAFFTVGFANFRLIVFLVYFSLFVKYSLDFLFKKHCPLVHAILWS